MKNRVDDSDLAGFIQKFGTVFVEFKSQGRAYNFYYVLFIAKRVAIAICVFFIPEAYIQLSITLILCLAVIFI